MCLGVGWCNVKRKNALIDNVELTKVRKGVESRASLAKSENILICMIVMLYCSMYVFHFISRKRETLVESC